MISPLYDMDGEELSKMLELAATLGAKKALSDIGLHDEKAGEDVKELRNLLDSWRKAKETAWKTTVDWLIKGFLGLLALGLYMKLGGK